MLPGEELLTEDADYHLLGLREETIARIPQATRDAMRQYGQDRVLGFLGKRALRPVVAWDSSFKRAAIVFALHAALIGRGVRPGGEDERILAAALADVKEWLGQVSTGKSEAWFQDSSPTVHEMGPLAGSVRLSDDEMRAGTCGGSPQEYISPRVRCSC